MGFNDPGLLAFAGGMAIPVIIHLLHRQRFVRVRWGAMQFLLNAYKKTHRRIRLENLILLLIRMAILGLLAAAIAGPFLRESNLLGLGETSTHYVFVIDNSMSMGYQKVHTRQIDAAKKTAKKLLEKIQAGGSDRFSLVLCSEFPEVRVSEFLRKEPMVQAIDSVELSEYGTSMPATFTLLSDLLDRSETVQRKIYLLTDMQENAWQTEGAEETEKFQVLLKKLCRPEKANHFFLVDCGDENPQNVGIIGVTPENRIARAGAAFPVVAKLYNYSDVPVTRLQVSVRVNGNPLSPQTVSIDPMKEAEVRFPLILSPVEGPQRITVEAARDMLPADDVRHLVVDARGAIRILLINGEPQSGLLDEVLAVQLALDPSGEGREFRVEVKTAETFPTETLDGYDAIFLCNVEHLLPEQVGKLKEYVETGGGLFVSLGEKVNRDFYNGEFYEEGKGLLPATLTELRGVELERIEREGDEPHHLGKIEYSHPIFEMDERRRPVLHSLEFAQFYGTANFDPQHVLARFDDAVQSPAWIEKSLGEGKVILFTSTMDLQWNWFPRRGSMFVPIVNRLAFYLASRSPTGKNLFIGDPIRFRLPLEQWFGELKLKHIEPSAEGRQEGRFGEVRIAPDKPDPAKGERFCWVVYPPQSARPEEPTSRRNEGLPYSGIYRLAYPGFNEGEGKPPLAYFAVNLGPRSGDDAALARAEGNLRRINAEQLRERFPGFKFEMSERVGEGEPNLPSPKTELGRTVLLAILFLLVTESLVALFFGRKNQ